MAEEHKRALLLTEDLKKIQSRITKLKQKNDWDEYSYSPDRNSDNNKFNFEVYDDEDDESSTTERDSNLLDSPYVQSDKVEINNNYGSTYAHTNSDLQSNMNLWKKGHTTTKSLTKYEKEFQSSEIYNMELLDEMPSDSKKFVDMHQVYYQSKNKGSLKDNTKSSIQKEGTNSSKYSQEQNSGVSYYNVLKSEKESEKMKPKYDKATRRVVPTSNDTVQLLLGGISEIKEEENESEKEQVFNFPTSSSNEGIIFDSAVNIDKESYENIPDTVKYPESNFQQNLETAKYASFGTNTLINTITPKNFMSTRNYGSKLSNTAFNKTNQTRYQPGMVQNVHKNDTRSQQFNNTNLTFNSTAKTPVNNKLSDRFHKLENDINTIQDHFIRIKTKSNYLSDRNQDLCSKKLDNQITDPNIEDKLKAKFSARTYMTNDDVSLDNKDTSSNETDHKGSKIQYAEDSQENMSFSNRDYMYNLSKKNNYLSESNKYSNYNFNEHRSSCSAKTEQENNKFESYKKDGLKDQYNATEMVETIDQRKSGINFAKSKSLKEALYGNSNSRKDISKRTLKDHNQGTQIDYSNNKRETCSEKLYESGNRNGTHKKSCEDNQDDDIYEFDDNKKAKTEKSIKSCINYNKDMIQLSDDEDDTIGAHLNAKNDCECCVNLKQKVIEHQRFKKLMKKKDIISIATNQRNEELKLQPKIPEFSFMCEKEYFNKKYDQKFIEKNGIFGKSAGLTEALMNFRKFALTT